MRSIAPGPYRLSHRSATDKGLRRFGGRPGSARSDDPPPSPLASPKSAESLNLANGAGDSGLPSPSGGSATSDAPPPRPGAPAGVAGAAGGAPAAERQRVALTSRAGDLSKAHMLADRERHFLEDELRVGWGGGGLPRACVCVCLCVRGGAQA